VLRGSTERDREVEVDGGVRRPRIASLPSKLNAGVKVDVIVNVIVNVEVGLDGPERGRKAGRSARNAPRSVLGGGAISGRSRGDLSTTLSVSGAAVGRRLAG